MFYYLTLLNESAAAGLKAGTEEQIIKGVLCEAPS